MAKMKHAGNRNTLYDNYTASKHSQGVVSAYEWVGEILAAVVVVVLIFTFLFRVVTVSGTSMYPNYHDGDRLIVTNTFGQPLEQGDVVVLVNVLEEPIIKRVIATENQTVDIDFPTGTVYVDGEPWMNPSLACPMESLPKLPPLWSGPSSPPQCRKDIFLCWATTARFRKTAVMLMWAW